MLQLWVSTQICSLSLELGETQTDVRSDCTAALLIETAICFTSADSVPSAWQNAVVAAGVAGLGASLYLVHMYVTPIKRFMQVRPLQTLCTCCLACSSLYITLHHHSLACRACTESVLQVHLVLH